MADPVYPEGTFERLAHDLTSDSDIINAGKVVEAGWQALRISCLHPDASPLQIDDMRAAFFSGAAHLFFGAFTILTTADEPEVERFKRMHAIETELRTFIADFELRRLPPQGSG